MAVSLLLPRSGVAPVFTRPSIRWRSVDAGMVEIEVDLENPDSEPSAPGELVIETAGLGAFVPFRPVTRIALGSLEPGERRPVRTRVRRDQLEAPITAPSNFGTTMADVLRTMGVKPEVIDLVSRSEWAGNLNVYFDRAPAQAVEVHRALGLRVTAGRPISVMVALPCDRSSFDLHLRLPDAGWKAEIVCAFMPMSLVVVQPPPLAGLRGAVTIEVTRRSDAFMVPVELTLETVDGRGDTLGCIQVGA
jgi:hypothetical protein